MPAGSKNSSCNPEYLEIPVIICKASSLARPTSMTMNCYLPAGILADYQMQRQGGGTLQGPTATNPAGSSNRSEEPPAGVVGTLNKNQVQAPNSTGQFTNNSQTNNGNLPPPSTGYQGPSQNDPHLAQKLAMQQQHFNPSMGQGYSSAYQQQQKQAEQASSCNSHNVYL